MKYLSVLWLAILVEHVTSNNADNSSSSLRRGNKSTTTTNVSDGGNKNMKQIREDGITDRDLIVGGSSATPHDYPYFVHLDTPGCGGTLIAPDIVLSAGHCRLDDMSGYGTVKVGRYTKYDNLDQSEEFTVVDQVRHPNYDGDVCCGSSDGTWFKAVHYDFLLLKLSGRSSAQTIRLNRNGNIPRTDENLHVIGFGDIDPMTDNFITPDMIHEVTVNYRPNDVCIRDSDAYPDYLLNEASLCAYDNGEDACGGDSGGPLIRKGQTDAQDIQVGIVSWYVCFINYFQISFFGEGL